ncbi:hypothetical protein GOV13_03225 [Candidatus Pacearchaeota archaeon]|nr:hypothetical protein [Candidatus Pacearchaeota archaeon]
MWQLKIRAREKWNIYNSRTVKFGVMIYFYSQNYYSEKGKLFFVASGIVDGELDQRNKFFRDLKKDKKVKHLDYKNDFFICIYEEPRTAKRTKAVKVAYNPKLIFLKPTIIDKEGWEEWEVASVDRKDLEAFIDESERLGIEFKVLHFNQKKIENIMIYSMIPTLTEKQKQVFLLAVKHGYFGYPRKVTLQKLAKMSNISLSTFQFHLAKAEAKLLPFVAKNI